MKILPNINFTTFFLVIALIMPETVTEFAQAQNNIQMSVTVNGLEKGDTATLVLSSKTASSNEASILNKTIEGDGGSITVDVNAKLKDDVYQLLLETPEKYFRDPKGYFFKIYQTEILNRAGRSIVFNLIPPSAQTFRPYRESNNMSTDTSDKLVTPTPSSTWGRIPDMSERIISLSGPMKQSFAAPAPTWGIIPERASRINNLFGSMKRPQFSILSTGRHYAGPWTSQDNDGVWGRFTVVDPGVRHDIDPDSEFVVRHVAVMNAALDKWMEIGWAEVSWQPDERDMYEFDTVDNVWNFYSLPTGNTLQVVVLRASGTTWEAQYYASGSWHVLASEDIGFSPADRAFNQGEIYTDMGTHPSLPSVSNDWAYLSISGQNELWDTRYATISRNDTPYDTHVTTGFYDFYIHYHQ